MITKSGIRLLYEGVSRVQLPNGRKIELASREGADDFVGAVGTDFISTNLTATDDEEDDEELAVAYGMMRMVIENASPEKIALGIPESELRTFIEHTRDILYTLSSDRNWIRSGALSICHELLLQVVAAFSKQIWFFKILCHSNEAMEAFAKFYASRKKNDTPNRKVAHLIVMIVNNAIAFLVQDGLSH
jgi:hypothetical protein